VSDAQVKQVKHVSTLCTHNEKMTTPKSYIEAAITRLPASPDSPVSVDDWGFPDDSGSLTREQRHWLRISRRLRRKYGVTNKPHGWGKGKRR
jgi:hypothetical protein